MPRFQLQIAIALVAAASTSILTLLWTRRSEEGKIKLPIHNDGHEFGQPATGHDALEVTTLEDVVEGYPVDEETFWKRVRSRKLFATVLLGMALVLNTVAFGGALANEGDSQNVLITGFQLFFSLYTFCLASHSTFKEDVDLHSKTILHLTSLTTIATLLLISSAILPDGTARGDGGIPDTLSSFLWYGSLCVYFAICIVTLTTPLGPALHYPPDSIYSQKQADMVTNEDPANVCGIANASPWELLMFSYAYKVVWLGNFAPSFEIGDLPVVPSSIRATFNYSRMRLAEKMFKLYILGWTPTPGSGWALMYRLLRLNWIALTAEFTLAIVGGAASYVPPLFLRGLIAYLEVDPGRTAPGWGWVYVYGLFISHTISFLISEQLWELAETIVPVRLKTQLNTTLFSKTLVRKDIASSAAMQSEDGDDANPAHASDAGTSEFSSKAQIMTLMTTDTDRIGRFGFHLFALVVAPVEMIAGSAILYSLIGVSCFYGLAVMLPFMPLNHYGGVVFVGIQENLMKARDERVALTNEILGAIRMLKFMAWERNFEKRVMTIRKRELKYQRLHFTIERLWNTIWAVSPLLVTLVAFWHYAVVRDQPLTPSVAFTSIMVFNQMKYSLNGLPETFINMLQCFVSLRRIEKYLNGAEVGAVPALSEQSTIIALKGCTITWPQDQPHSSSRPSTVPSTPKNKFVLVNLSLTFPPGELSLICGKLGSGKTLLLLALLGEADILSGRLMCPRSPPDSLVANSNKSGAEWNVEGMCAYVPQAAWLINASIKDNILFNLPYDENRYQATLEACALISDLEILEDGDESEIGERGITLSGGQKARVSLARAVYSRASVIFLDDVLSAVDAHTAHHLYHKCLKGELMQGRTVILVSHHVQLCIQGAAYVVALDNGRVSFEGGRDEFRASDMIQKLGPTTGVNEPKSDGQEKMQLVDIEETRLASTPSTVGGKQSVPAKSSVIPVVKEKKPAKKLVEEEFRAVGHIDKDVWSTLIWASGQYLHWTLFAIVFTAASVSPVLENSWLKYWSAAALRGHDDNPSFYLSVYAAITGVGVLLSTIRWFVLYSGSIRASTVLYERLLEAVLFADIRFHDTISKGRLLNRFGKDFEGIDTGLADNFGKTVMFALSGSTTILTVSYVGGTPFVFVTLILGAVYYNAAKFYGQPSRNLRRLDSVSRSPIYTIYGETIAGAPVIRAFGASSKLLRDMLRTVDTNLNPFYWTWKVNRWLAIRSNILSAGMVGAAGLACLLTPGINASLAGFTLAFATKITGEMLFLVRRYVNLEQSMVALERVKEYSDLKREPPEIIEPRPEASWPSHGNIKCEDLVVRYAPGLPDVLHQLNFEIRPGEKVGILGRTGSGKSTLALSFFRFVEATQGRLVIDGVDIAKIGLTDLRGRLTIIPQDPSVLSGTLRLTLDVFGEYEDAEIYEALRRVHLIPSESTPEEVPETVNATAFRDLDFSVSEGGDNFSTGEKQLLCMARAILKRSKVLVMDEATASVDYATDELIGRTIRHEFAESTILTIAHRLRTVIDYDRVMLLDQGHIVEFDTPQVLLGDSTSQFYGLCKATGKEEFASLLEMAGLSY